MLQVARAKVDFEFIKNKDEVHLVLNDFNMKVAVESANATIPTSIKTIALALTIFIVGIASGIILFQSSTSNDGEGVQQEFVDLSHQQVWYNLSGWTEAAIVVTNTGGKDTILKKVAVRGIECNWNDIYYWKTENGPISNALKPTSTELSGNSFTIVVDNKPRIFQQATNNLILESGCTIVLYMNNPGNITSNDINSKVIIAITSKNRLYYKEANIEAQAAGQQAGVMLYKANCRFYTQGGTYKIDIDVGNRGTSDTKIAKVYVGTSEGNRTEQTPTQTLPLSLTSGSIVTVTINYNWTAGTTYYFRILSSYGPALEFPEQAPAS